MTIVKESGHWYSPDGTPAYTRIGKNGKERNTTLADARKEGLSPSVTSVLKVKAAPGLEVWKQNQILLAAATLPKIEGEAVDDWIKRVKEDAGEHAKQAREKGTMIHGWLEEWFGGERKKVPAEAEPYITGVQKVYDEIGFVPGETEKSFTSVLGYGGKRDQDGELNGSPAIVDYKTTEFDKDTPINKLAYFDHCTQLAAYAEGDPKKRILNIYVSTSNPGEVKYLEWSNTDAYIGFDIFMNLFRVWQLERGYYPAGRMV